MTQQSKGSDSYMYGCSKGSCCQVHRPSVRAARLSDPLKSESEELCVPEPEGVDLGIVPEEYLTEEAQSEEAAHLYSRDRAGLKEEQEERTPSPSPRFEEITD